MILTYVVRAEFTECKEEMYQMRFLSVGRGVWQTGQFGLSAISEMFTRVHEGEDYYSGRVGLESRNDFR